jgi:hypothetical protein
MLTATKYAARSNDRPRSALQKSPQRSSALSALKSLIQRQGGQEGEKTKHRLL